MMNETNFKVEREAVEIVLNCMNLDLTLRVKEPIPTFDNLQKVKIEKWKHSKRMCLMIMKRSIPEAFQDSISKSQSASKFLEEIEQFLPKMKRQRRYKGKGNIREYIMEMSNLAAKLKSLKLELDEDLIVHLVLTSLPTHFGQFKVSYNTQKDKWSLNELISYCVQEEERLQRDKIEIAHFASISQNKKRKNIKDVVEGSSKGKKPKKNEEFTCFFFCSEVNLTFVPTNTWWGCLWSRPPSDDERFIFLEDDNKVAIETIGTFMLQLKIGFHLDLFETFIVPSFRRNLISISSLDKFSFSYSFGNNKRKLIENSIILWHKRLGHISKQRIQRLVLDEILESLDLSNFKVCVECIKGKRTNIRKLGAKRAKNVLELIHIDICGPFPTASWNGRQYFIMFIDDYFRYDYLYLIHEKSQPLDIFKSFKAEVELQLRKKIKVIKSYCGGEYYGRYYGSGEQCLGPFALFLKECGIVPQYTILGKPSMNGVAKR
ncbi:hypothetical protein CR513_08064, partial [Mucuna pruriens]